MNRNAIVLFVVLAGFGAIRAQSSKGIEAGHLTTVPHRINIDQAVRLALQHNNGLVADSLDIAVHTANLRQVCMPQNPDLVVESEDIHGGFSEGTKISVQIEQELNPLGRIRKTDVARSELVMAKTGLAVQKAELVAKVKTKFFELLRLQHELVLSNSLVVVASQVHNAAVQQARSGKVSLSDTLSSSVECILAQIQRDRDYRNLLNARQELAEAWNMQNIDFTGEGAFFDAIVTLPDSNMVFSDQQIVPENEFLLAKVTERVAELNLAKIEFVPSLKVGVGMATIRGTEEHFPKGEIAMSLPLFNRNQGGVQAARHSLDLAGYHLKAYSIGIQNRVIGTYRQATQLFREATLFKTIVLPQLEENLQNAYISYTSGKTGIQPLLSAQQKCFTSSRDLLKTIEEYLETLIVLERITGKPILTPKN